MPELYKYQLCNYSTIIFRSIDEGPFIEIADDICYERIGLVSSDATANVETITDTPDDCAACLEGHDNFQWKKCSDDSDAAIFDPANNPVEDFAWLEISGVFVECYFDRKTGITATNPCVVVSGGIISPTQCSEIVFADFSDNFNDATIGCQWSQVLSNDASGSGITELSSSIELKIKSLGGNGAAVLSLNNNLAISGNLDIEISGITTLSPGSLYNVYYMYVFLGGVRMRIEIGENIGSTRTFCQFGAEAIIDFGTSVPVAFGDYDLRITRESDNKIRAYQAGNERGVSTSTYTGDLEKIEIVALTANTGDFLTLDVNQFTTIG